MDQDPELQSTDADTMEPTRGHFSRRRALGGLAVLGVGTAAISSLLTGCDTNSTNGSSGTLGTDNKPKPATDATKAANQKVLDTLPFNDKSDFDDAKRGLIKRPDTLTIKDAGKVVWDMEEFKSYIGDDKAAPDTVNPSLWRNAQLNMHYGLFEVVPDRIYQVRGYDLSNITFVRGDTGWIVFDPLISPETAKAALDLANKELGARPVLAVIHSHSHTDHYGGVRGVISQADVDAGKVKVIAPANYVADAVSENVIAGNAMSRRAVRGPEEGIRADRRGRRAQLRAHAGSRRERHRHSRQGDPRRHPARKHQTR